MQSLLQYHALNKRALVENRHPIEEVGVETCQDVPTRTWQEQRQAALRETSSRGFNIHQSLQLSTHTLRSDLQPAVDIERADWDLDLGVRMSETTTYQADDARYCVAATGVDMTEEENGKPDGEKTFVVSFEHEDNPNDPHNWRPHYRALCTAYLSFMAAAVEFVSIADFLGIEEAATGGKVNREVKFLMTGGYLIGLGFGCLFSAPFSEVFGRNPVYIFSLIGLSFMLIIQHFQHALGYKAIIRTIGAFLGSGTTVSSASAILNIWTRLDRSYIFAIYVCIVFACPLLASIIGPIIITSAMT